MNLSPAATAWLFRAAVAAAALIAYHNALSGAFVFDDLAAIVRNEGLRDLGTTLRGLPTNTRPVTELSFAISYAAGGREPIPFHFHWPSVAAHTAAALLLFGLVRRTLALPRCRTWAGAAGDWLALAIALLWAVHPLCTEAVSYAVQRAQVLAGLFMLLTLYCLARGATATGGRGWWYAGAVAAAALAVGSKQDAVVIPLVAVLYDRIFLAGSWQGVIRRWPVHVPLLLTLLLLAVSVRLAVAGLDHAPPPPPSDGTVTSTSVSPARPSAGFVAANATPREYALTQCGAVWHYLRLAVWPHPLCFDYHDWPLARGLPDVAPAVVGVAVLLLISGWLLWRRPPVGFACAWVFLTLAPTSSVMPIDDLVVEHRMYAPLMGLAVLAVALVWAVVRSRGPVARWAAVVAVVATVVGETALTIARNKDYQTEESVWRSVTVTRPANARAEHNLAVTLVKAGRLPEAVSHFERAAELHPTPSTHAQLAQALLDCGRTADAIPHFRAALAADPPPADPRGFPEAKEVTPFLLHFNLATALCERGEWAEAITHYDRAVELEPTSVKARINASRPFVALGRWQEAADVLREAVRLDPASALANNNLGLVLARLGRTDEAVVCFERAAAADPNDARVFNNWGGLLDRQGRPKEAVRVFTRGLTCRPAHPQLAFGLAHALHAAGQDSEARQVYSQAVRAAPGLPSQLAGTAWVLATHPKAELRDPPEAVRLAETAAQASNDTNPQLLDVLAAAYAAAARFEEAVSVGERAEKACPANHPDVAGIRERLRLYRVGKAYTQPDAPR